MFWTEEDVRPAVEAAVRVFGKTGNMMSGKSVMYNMSVASKEFGKLWYGDVEQSSELVGMLNALSESINQKVYLLDEQFDFNSPILMSTK